MSIKSWWCFGVVVGALAGQSPLFAQTSQSISLAWNASPSPNVASYVVRYGGSSGQYASSTNVGNQTSARIGGLQAGQTYYFSVTARDSAGLESAPSNEISYLVPQTTAPTISLTAPSAGATFSAPASISLAASVNANGHSISKVQFYNGSALLGEDSTAPYNFTWNNVGVGTYNLSARVLYGAGNVASSSVAITVAGLPAPWLTRDIGSVGTPGSATVSGSSYTVSGAGNLNGRSDSFRFVYQTLSADGEIKARINSLSGTGSNKRVGVMMRESLAANSKYAFMGLGNSLEFRSQRRRSTGGSTSTSKSGTGQMPATWVRLVRKGNTIYADKSTDGANWTRVNSVSITMASNISVGFAVASGNTSGTISSVFSDVTVVP